MNVTESNSTLAIKDPPSEVEMDLKKEYNVTWVVLEYFVKQYEEFIEFFVDDEEEIEETIQMSLKPLIFRGRVDQHAKVTISFNQELQPWRNVTALVEKMRLNETEGNYHINFIELWVEPGDNHDFWDSELEGE